MVIKSIKENDYQYKYSNIDRTSMNIKEGDHKYRDNM